MSESEVVGDDDKENESVRAQSLLEFFFILHDICKKRNVCIFDV
jgi:hypothetical protein